MSHAPLRLSTLTLTLTLSASLSCRKEAEVGGRESPAQRASTAAAVAARLDARRDASVTIDATPGQSDSRGPEQGMDAGAGSPLGIWMEGNLYRLKVEEARRCGNKASSGGPDAGTGPTLLGVRVRVTAKIDQLLVAPRDLTLESEGVIFQTKILTKAMSTLGCAPALAPRQLRVGESAGGFVVFELPSDFRVDPRGPQLAYQPTRWGGAKRTEVRLPACLPDCQGPAPPRETRRSALRARNRE